MKQTLLVAVLYSCGNNVKSNGLSYGKIMGSAYLFTEFIQSLK